jgi:hypothetical protein
MSYLEEQALQEPQDWDAGGRVHNWRNHVGENVKAIWHTFTPKQKIAIALDADEAAGAEEWE